VHIFTHQRLAYHFEPEVRPTGWRGTSSPAARCRRTTCSGISGAPPARARLAYKRKSLSTDRRGLAAHMDAHKDEILPLFADTYGAATSASGGPTGGSSS